MTFISLILFLVSRYNIYAFTNAMVKNAKKKIASTLGSSSSAYRKSYDHSFITVVQFMTGLILTSVSSTFVSRIMICII
jgi:hypothetical protein